MLKWLQNTLALFSQEPAHQANTLPQQLAPGEQVLRGLDAGLEPLRPRVLVLIFDPLIESRGNLRLSQLLGWNDPEKLAQLYIQDLAQASGGLVQYTIVERHLIDGLPVKVDGFSYDDESFLEAWQRGSGFHQPDRLDYARLIDNYRLDDRVGRGQCDEVWLFGPPYMGCWESTMAGPGSFWCNSNPVTASCCTRRYVIMGFNYERDVGCMLENFGHRTESIMSKVYANHSKEQNLWERFCRYDQIVPNRSECGNVHFAPNSQRDYDWGNRRTVLSYCDNWYNFPYLQGPPREVDAHEWGNGDMRGHHIWWLDHLPRTSGQTNGVDHNWWPYIVDPNRV
jgi:hypothetical protein